MVRKPRWRTRDIRSLIYPRYGYPWCTRPSTKALLYLVPSKYLFLSSSRAHLSEITFVHREPQQIFVGVNTEYGANVVKARVNVPITLLHIYWVCQYKLFLISEGWEGFTKPSDLHCMEYHWSENQKISNSNTVFSSYILDSDFGFKYFLKLFCTKITL